MPRCSADTSSNGRHSRPAALAAPALHTLYGSQVDHQGYLAIALSQSGATPEITTVLASMARTGARTIAITNDPCSPLARVPDLVYPLDAGDELAVPATKTVTAQMLAVTVIASVFGTADASESDVYALPELVRRVLNSSGAAEQLAAVWAPSATRVVVVSRGYGYAAALEAALKITEATGVHAQAFSAADLRHGPIASVNSNTPVLIIDTGGPGARDLAALAALARGRGAPVAWCSSSPGADLPLPACEAESLSAILATVQAQQLALALALARGVDPDAPPGLTKVTETH